MGSTPPPEASLVHNWPRRGHAISSSNRGSVSCGCGKLSLSLYIALRKGYSLCCPLDIVTGCLAQQQPYCATRGRDEPKMAEHKHRKSPDPQ